MKVDTSQEIASLENGLRVHGDLNLCKYIQSLDE